MESVFTFNQTILRRAVASMATAVAGCLLLVSCIENDIPYPRIQPNFTVFDVEGASRQATIDPTNREITVYLSEAVDIHNVKIANYELDPEDSSWDDCEAWFEGVDLSETVSTTVSLYQEYTWQVTAIQSLERSFAVENQIGASIIDVDAHTVEATVSSRSDIHSVHVTEIKLGGSTSTISPDIADQDVDFSSPVTVTVTEFGRSVDWVITVNMAESEVSTEGADAWSMVAWLYGAAEEGKSNGFEYRVQGSSEWESVPQSWIETDGGRFIARLVHLKPLTTYEYRAVSGDDAGSIMQFTTGATPLIPNGDFSQWWQNGKVWCPWSESGESWWDTGNKGATTLGDSNSTPTNDAPAGLSSAARLETRFVGIGPLGKLAAGNIFAGSYVKTDGTNGILSFGRQWSDRPTRLKGQLKYVTAPISHATEGYTGMIGQPDTCVVWVALIDSAEPFEIRTNPKNRNLFNPEADYVVAYGRFQSGKSIESYTSFDVELEYRSKSRVPRYVILTASSSKYGDFFTGGNGAVLYVTDLKFDYDY